MYYLLHNKPHITQHLHFTLIHILLNNVNNAGSKQTIGTIFGVNGKLNSSSPRFSVQNGPIFVNKQINYIFK